MVKAGFFQKVLAKFSNFSKIVPQLFIPVNEITKYW